MQIVFREGKHVRSVDNGGSKALFQTSSGFRARLRQNAVSCCTVNPVFADLSLSLSLVRATKEVAKNGLGGMYTRSALSLNKRWEKCAQVKGRSHHLNIHFLFITCEWSSSLRKLGRNTWEGASHRERERETAICRRWSPRYFSS